MVCADGVRVVAVTQQSDLSGPVGRMVARVLVLLDGLPLSPGACPPIGDGWLGPYFLYKRTAH